MCRHLAYLGPPVRLSTLLSDPPHSLVRQSWAPRDMRGTATINADGFGIGWFPQTGGAPLRYRRDHPIWSDAELSGLAAATTAPAVLAAVRSASPGMPPGEAACAPFAEDACEPDQLPGTGDGWLFSLNGRVEGWPDSMAPLAARLPVTDLLTMAAPVDSLLMWALVRHRLRGGAGPAEAVESTVTEVAAAAPGSRLNLLLTDGRRLVATAAGHSLSVRARDDSVLVASEPLEGGPDWRPLPDGTLFHAHLPADQGVEHVSRSLSA
jgi:glutamine amidotransferase